VSTVDEKRSCASTKFPPLSTRITCPSPNKKHTVRGALFCARWLELQMTPESVPNIFSGKAKDQARQAITEQIVAAAGQSY
jgi:hypothetical protein